MAVVVMEAHPTFDSPPPEEQERVLEDLRRAGVRIAYDMPPTDPVMLERQAGLGAYAFRLAMWPSRAHLVSPDGIILAESVLDPAVTFNTAQIRSWLEDHAGISVGIDFYAARMGMRALARFDHWLVQVGLEKPSTCSGECLAGVDGVK